VMRPRAASATAPTASTAASTSSGCPYATAAAVAGFATASAATTPAAQVEWRCSWTRPASHNPPQPQGRSTRAHRGGTARALRDLPHVPAPRRAHASGSRGSPSAPRFRARPAGAHAPPRLPRDRRRRDSRRGCRTRRRPSPTARATRGRDRASGSRSQTSHRALRAPA
jgi:hypothetical protein